MNFWLSKLKPLPFLYNFMDILDQSFYLVAKGGFPLIRVPGGLCVYECGWGDCVCV